MDYRPGKIKRPLQERFDMQLDESLAFWGHIMAEYSFRYVREFSILLYSSNRFLVSSEGESNE